MAIVVPDSILANPSARDVRELIARESQVLAVVKLPSETFLPYGSTAESSLLFLKKRDSLDGEASVLMAEAKYVGYDRLGQQIEANDLPTILKAYLEFHVSGRSGVLSVNPKIFVPQELRQLERLDVRYYWHPDLDETVAQLRKLPCPIEQIGDVVNFKKDVVNPAQEFPEKEFRYIGLANVSHYSNRLVYKESNSGANRMRPHKQKMMGKDIHGTALRMYPRCVLFARLRPYLKKVFVAPLDLENAICSTEFLVMSPGSAIDPEYLAYLLRSDITLRQLSHQYTGIGRPRVTQRMVSQVLIPVPDRDIQRKIVQVTHDFSERIAMTTKQMDKMRDEIENMKRTLDVNVLEILQKKQSSNV